MDYKCIPSVERRELLEAAILKCDTKQCHALLQEIDVNIPLGKKQEPALIVAVKKQNLKMVRFLVKYANSSNTKTMALDLALGCKAWYNLDIIQPLIHSGAYTLSPVNLGRFFKEHVSDPKKCRQFLDIICNKAKEDGWRKLGNDSQMYKLLGALLKMAMVVPYRLDLGLQPDHQYIPGWSTYQLVLYLLMSGANAENHWDPLFHDRFNKMRYRDSVLPLDHSVFCLYVRTSVGRILPHKVESLLASYISVRIKFMENNHMIFGLIENMLRVLLWCGVKIADMKLYDMARSRSVANPHTNTRTINTYKNMKSIFDKVERFQLMSLQDICRLSIQRNIKGPNLLYSLDSIEGFPKAMKDLITLENKPEVAELEKQNDTKRVTVQMAIS